MSDSIDVWQCVDQKSQRSHCSIKFDLFNDARAVITKDIMQERVTESKISTTTPEMCCLGNAELMELMPHQFTCKINNTKLNERHVDILKGFAGTTDMVKFLASCKEQCFKSNMLVDVYHVVVSGIS